MNTEIVNYYTEDDIRRALSQSFTASQDGYDITADEIIQSLQEEKMKQKTKIFLVSSGEYSDYYVCGVYTTRELAQMFIDTFKNKYDEFRIEEDVLNPFQYELKNGYKPFFLRMKKDGECVEIKIQDYAGGISDTGIDIGFDINEDMFVTVFAKHERHAIKIANEKRIELIANNLWLNYKKN